MYLLSTLAIPIIDIVVYYELQYYPEQCPDLAEEYHGPVVHYQPPLGQKEVNRKE